MKKIDEMIFDESKIIDALHADKAEIGKKYIFACSIESLKNVVGSKFLIEDFTHILISVNFENYASRFPFEADGDMYSFLYPYEEIDDLY